MAFHDRWNDDDVLDKDGQSVLLSDADIAGVRREVLEVLSRYRALDVPYIAALLGRDPLHVYACVKELRSRSNRYIQLVWAQRERMRSFPINSSMFFELSPKGIAFLRSQDIAVRTREDFRNTTHKMMEQHIMASFEIAAKNHQHIRLWTREEIIADPRSNGMRNPETVELTKDHTIRFDGSAFALEQPGKVRWFFPGIEAETGDHSIEAVALKFRDNISLFQKGIHETRYNAKNSLRIPYFTPSTEHLKNMMKRWERETQKYRELRPRLWFKTHPTFLSKEKPRPTAHMFEEPFLYINTDGQTQQLHLLQ